MDERERRLRHNWQAFDTLENILSNSGFLQMAARSLVDAHISPNPLLNERRKDCSRQTAYEAQKPENTDSAVRSRYMKGRIRQWSSSIEGDLGLGANRCDLLRYLGEHLNRLLLVVG